MISGRFDEMRVGFAYPMNLVDLLVILLLAVAIVAGARAGFLGPVLGLLGAAGAFALALWLAGILREPLTGIEQPTRALVTLLGMGVLVLLGETLGAAAGARLSLGLRGSPSARIRRRGRRDRGSRARRPAPLAAGRDDRHGARPVDRGGGARVGCAAGHRRTPAAPDLGGRTSPCAARHDRPPAALRRTGAATRRAGGRADRCRGAGARGVGHGKHGEDHRRRMRGRPGGRQRLLRLRHRCDHERPCRRRQLLDDRHPRGIDLRRRRHRLRRRCRPRAAARPRRPGTGPVPGDTRTGTRVNRGGDRLPGRRPAHRHARRRDGRARRAGAEHLWRGCRSALRGRAQRLGPPGQLGRPARGGAGRRGRRDLRRVAARPDVGYAIGADEAVERIGPSIGSTAAVDTGGCL